MQLTLDGRRCDEEQMEGFVHLMILERERNDKKGDHAPFHVNPPFRLSGPLLPRRCGAVDMRPIETVLGLLLITPATPLTGRLLLLVLRMSEAWLLWNVRFTGCRGLSLGIGRRRRSYNEFRRLLDVLVLNVRVAFALPIPSNFEYYINNKILN